MNTQKEIKEKINKLTKERTQMVENKTGTMEEYNEICKEITRLSNLLFETF